MGFLDELKNKTTEQQQKEAQERARQEELERVYRQTIQPKLEYIYTYLKQMCEHLNYIDNAQTVSYALPGHGEWKDLTQRDYSVKADSRDNMKEVLLSFLCLGPDEELQIHAKSKKDFDKYNDFYSGVRLNYSTKIIKDEGQEQIGGYFSLIQRVPVLIGFFADIGNSQVHLRMRNFPDFGQRYYTLKAEMIDEGLMDDLAKHIVHQNQDFMRLDLSNDVRQNLQKKIREEQAQRQRELDEAERALAAEKLLEQARNVSVLDKLKSGIKNIAKK